MTDETRKAVEAALALPCAGYALHRDNAAASLCRAIAQKFRAGDEDGALTDCAERFSKGQGSLALLWQLALLLQEAGEIALTYRALLLYAQSEERRMCSCARMAKRRGEGRLVRPARILLASVREACRAFAEEGETRLLEADFPRIVSRPPEEVAADAWAVYARGGFY